MKAIRNARGFSLVSTMVAAAITGGLALVGMKLMDNVSTTKQVSDTNQEAREMLSEMRFILENEKNCRASLDDGSGTGLVFQKSSIDNPNTKPGKPIELWLSNSQGTARTQKKFAAGAEFGRLKISSIELHMNNGTGSYPSGYNSDLGIVRVKYEVKNSNKSYTKDFMINVESNTVGSNSTVRGCSRNPARNVCDSVNMTFDPASGKCVVPGDTCDPWHVIANADGWSGWRSHACNRIAGGYIQSVQFSQSRENSGDKDWNGMSVRCCYSKRMETTNCSTVSLEGTNHWTGSREGQCNAQPRGFLRGVSFYQYRWNSGDKETNGMSIQCCYPN